MNTNKTVIITGGLGLIGSEFSRACAEKGMNVVIIDISEKGPSFTGQLKQHANNQNIVYFRCDITKPEEVEATINRILTIFPRIDALVNNAYPRNNNYGKKFEDVNIEDFNDNINMHLGGYFLITQKVSKIMIKQKSGNIINMASIYGFAAPRFEVYEGTEMTMPIEYAAIKGAILNLTTYLASYLGKHNIRVNAISPGGVFANQPSTFTVAYNKKVLCGNRMATVEDLSGVLMFLLSDASKYITGQNIITDGGYSL